MAAPCNDWREQIAPDEAERFVGHAAQFAQMQQAKFARYGTGRALHRKQRLGLAATLDVTDGLPGHARHGLFAARVRLRPVGQPARAQGTAWAEDMSARLRQAPLAFEPKSGSCREAMT